jgi:glycerol uptake facilitator-like aquaporin
MSAHPRQSAAMTAARHQSSAAKGPPRRSASTRFYWFFSLTVAILIAFEAFLTSLPFADAIPDYAEALQQRQLDSYFQMIQLLITLATLVMGGITGFVINKGREIGLSGPQLRRVVASWVLCAASLYFGYLAYQQVVWMLNHGFFNPYNPRVWIPTRGQFWSFLACVVVFADFVYAGLSRAEPASAEPT